jgi:acyl dehydratase
MSASPPALPQALTTFRGVIPEPMSIGAAEGMGEYGDPARELIASGIVPPDVLTGMTLHLLATQPRRERTSGEKPKGAIEGGVWVREQVTYHAPMRIGEEILIEGASIQRFSRRGRRYGVNTSETRGADGRLIVSSCTTGLIQYRKEEGLEDAVEGEEVKISGVDHTVAANNPCGARLAEASLGGIIDGGEALVTLEMMRTRDAHRDDNPIHTDPKVAAREGLAAPIAGGSHVLAFLQAGLMAEWGAEALLHGAHFDVQWKGQTYAGARIRPSATVAAVGDALELELHIWGEERVALEGRALIPLGPTRP